MPRVGRRVPHGVVGDRLIAIADQLVLPVTGEIPVSDRVRRRAWISCRGIGVNVLCGKVPPDVVGIRHRLVREGVVLPHQLVGTVILVGDGSRPLSDRGYVPVVVVDVGGVVAILARGR